MRNFIIVFFVLVGFISRGQDGGSMNGISGGALKPEQENMDIRHYTIVLDVDPAARSYKGYTEIDLMLKRATNTLLFDLKQFYTVSGITVNGKTQAFTHNGGLVRITSSQNFSIGRQTVRINYGGKPPVAKNAPWDTGIQWERDSLGRHWIAQTCQGDGGQIFFPCKDHPSDEPNEGADMIITVPKGLVVTGPGLLVKSATKGNKTTFHWKTNYTISNYCLVFNAGHYLVEKRTYTTSDGNTLPMEYYVLDYNKQKAARHLDLLEQSCRILEKYWGEYPWVKEKIAIVETPHLGMEHQTMNAYGNRYRYTKIGNSDFDWLLHHEFGHEWFANKVSNNDWGHMWIQEGITSFGDALAREELGGKRAYLDYMWQLGHSSQNKIPIVQGDTVDSKQAYHGDIYSKGAFFMHTLRYVMGDEKFFPALKAFATDTRYTYDNMVSTKDLMMHFNKAAGTDLSPLFRLYLYTTDKLQLQVSELAAGTYQIRVLDLDMPVPLDVQTSEGRQRIMVSSRATVVSSKAMPVLDPDGYYLKKVTME